MKTDRKNKSAEMILFLCAFIAGGWWPIVGGDGGVSFLFASVLDDLAQGLDGEAGVAALNSRYIGPIKVLSALDPGK